MSTYCDFSSLGKAAINQKVYLSLLVSVDAYNSTVRLIFFSQFWITSDFQKSCKKFRGLYTSNPVFPNANILYKIVKLSKQSNYYCLTLLIKINSRGLVTLAKPELLIPMFWKKTLKTLWY